MYFTMIAPQSISLDPAAGSGVSNGMGAPYRSYIERGTKPVLFSDMCGVETMLPRPLFSIAAACNELGKGGSALAGEAIDFESAVSMWTVWAAESSHQDHDRGSLFPGALGDLAILTGDPDALAPDELFGLDVHATVLGGLIVHLRDESAFNNLVRNPNTPKE